MSVLLCSWVWEPRYRCQSLRLRERHNYFYFLSTFPHSQSEELPLTMVDAGNELDF